jgi:hypothetical protein
MRTGPVIAVLKVREVMRVSQECHIFNQTVQHPVDKCSAAHILPVSLMKRKLSLCQSRSGKNEDSELE